MTSAPTYGYNNSRKEVQTNMSKIVQLTFSEEQFQELERRAGTLSVQQYLIGREFPQNDFNKWFPILLERVSEIRNDGRQFTVREVMSTDWNLIPKGIKLSLGRVFFQRVVDNDVNRKVFNVRPLEPDKSKTQKYIKEANQ